MLEGQFSALVTGSVINIYTDVFITNLDDSLITDLFGLSLPQMFRESDTIFSNEGEKRFSDVAEFMKAVKSTWDYDNCGDSVLDPQ